MKYLTHFELAEMYGKRRDSIKRTLDKCSYPRIERNIKQSRGGKPITVYIVEDTPKLHEMFTSRSFAQMEHGALCAIEQLLNIKLNRQYLIGDYRIDGYDEVNNVVYEIDEQQHTYTIDADHERQVYIQSKLRCKFVRIKV